MNDNNLIVPAAAIVAILALLAGVLIARPDQAAVMVPLAATVILGLMSVIRGEKAVSTSEKAVQGVEETKARVEDVHLQSNSIREQMIALAAKGARAEGVLTGRAEEKAAHTGVVVASDPPTVLPVTVDKVEMSATSVEVHTDDVKTTPKKDA